jgi:hypothetical protein
MLIRLLRVAAPPHARKVVRRAASLAGGGAAAGRPKTGFRHWEDREMNDGPAVRGWSCANSLRPELSETFRAIHEHFRVMRTLRRLGRAGQYLENDLLKRFLRMIVSGPEFALKHRRTCNLARRRRSFPSSTQVMDAPFVGGGVAGIVRPFAEARNDPATAGGTTARVIRRVQSETCFGVSAESSGRFFEIAIRVQRR